ncbi:MAG TPA: hypothetical protein VFT78_04550, partial [Hanamia sp.]|nr:hypothetical protein [Hanamia sp.]
GSISRNKIKWQQNMPYSFVPKEGGSTSPEWWVNINRNGGSTWFGIYNLDKKPPTFEIGS